MHHDVLRILIFLAHNGLHSVDCNILCYLRGKSEVSIVPRATPSPLFKPAPQRFFTAGDMFLLAPTETEKRTRTARRRAV